MSNLSSKNLPPKIAVLASGRGSNFEALCRAIESNKLHAKVVLLLSNVRDAGVLKIAEKYSIPSVVIEHRGKTREEHEREVLSCLEKYAPDWVVLAGYMRVLNESFIQKFWDEEKQVSRIANIHPSLLPQFKGVDAYAQALKSGSSKTGATVHLVTIGVDEGPIVAQESFEIEKGENLDSLMTKGLQLEHRLYPKALERLFHDEWVCANNRIIFKGTAYD